MKTLEEMAKEALKGVPIDSEWGNGCYNGFLAGYKAAQDQLADADKVMPDTCEHILDMGKMVDVNGWISVKDRLPGPYEKVTTCWSGKDIYWMPIPEPPKEEE
jgi:hypothetical protein